MWNNLYYLKGWYKFGNKIKLLFSRLKVINFKKNTILFVQYLFYVRDLTSMLQYKAVKNQNCLV